jgi:hypothetical protein
MASSSPSQTVIHTRLPPLGRSPSPNLIESLVPAPLRKTRPAPRSVTPVARYNYNNSQTLPVPANGFTPHLRLGRDDFPLKRCDEIRTARSVSPLPQGNPPYIRHWTPPPPRAASANSQPRRPTLENMERSIPPPNYNPDEPSRRRPNDRRVRRPSGDVRVPEPLQTNRGRQCKPPPVSRVEARAPASQKSTSAPPAELPAEAVQKARKHTTNMDYLSLEQLENLWESQSLYIGTVDVPTKPTNPVWHFNGTDPRSPIHPAFRAEPFSIHNSFAPVRM